MKRPGRKPQVSSNERKEQPPGSRRLERRVAVVTGAARGLGRAAAVRLAADGASVGILDARDARETYEAIQAAGGVAEFYRCDVTVERELLEAFAAVGERFGVVDILVNNAGIIQKDTAWHSLATEEVERFIRVNYVGAWLTTKTAYPLLRRSHSGRIINVASRLVFSPIPGQMAYIASKGAVIGMNRSLAQELGAQGITVNAVVPGIVATDGTRAFRDEAAFDSAVMGQAIKRRVRPEDLAGLIAFLAGDEAAMITGQTIFCDGGGYFH